MSEPSLGLRAWIVAAVLGVVQGVTEFLPVSSSGHLVVAQQLVPPEGDDVLFDLVLHVGTLLPALWFYRADVGRMLRDAVGGEGPWLQRPGVRLALLVAVATVPTAIVGLTLKDVFEALFHTPAAVAVAFAATGLLLWRTRGLEDGVIELADVPWRTALLVGLAQGIAITPGISRSGATIATALLLGLRRELAVKLSFLMSVPAILGAVVLKLREVDGAGLAAGPMAVGFLAAMITGYGALVLLVRLVRLGRFSSFAWYLWAAALGTGLLVLAQGA
ncbi:MAG: undecaprenyl-diphosphate phosphatase [Alphaproteobacteria bacterium]|nr:undecaprenyl-diphosphate phosphatase [Alphaproteobacteria bacterium]